MAEVAEETTEEVITTPKFIREFSKETSQKERIELTKEAGEKLSKLRGQIGQAAELTPEKAKAREEVKNMIDNFYWREKEKWAEAPYSKDDIKKYFTEEHLSSLPMQDYILLLKRFPSEMVTNVVWQGIRDHPGIEGRLPGRFSNGFLEMLADGKLRSPFGKFLKDGFKREAVAQCLGITKTAYTKNREVDKNEALKTLDYYISGGQGGPESYADYIAVHTAAEEVADYYYGAETGNEIFFVFPAAYIAANYWYTGKFKAGGGNHNDFWAWEEKGTGGIKLDTGVLFLPADAKVNPVTGSRYELDVDKKPSFDYDKINLIKRFVQSEKFASFVDQARQIYQKSEAEWDFGSLKRILAEEFQITDPKIQEEIRRIPTLNALVSAKEAEARGTGLNHDVATGTLGGVEAAAEDLLMNVRQTYKESQNTITSREYWEKFFALHPGLKPKRVVYYHGSNPTEAFREWRKENGLTKKSESPGLGFPERQISYEDPRAMWGMRRFKSIGLKVINDYFD